MAKSPVSFAAGDEVEISCDDEGFRGAWYEARVVRSMPKLRRYSIVYETLMDESDPAKNLRETVDGTHVRPRPPRRATSHFELHQPVDAFHNDGWWTGVISRVQEEGVERRYTLCFPESKEELEFRAKEIRIHMEWVDGEWILPQSQDMLETEFRKGAIVEVSSDDEGFRGAWFTATIIRSNGKDFLVEYQNLRTDDETELLTETVDSLHIRPTPPDTPVVERFKLLEEVDAFHNDGWWVGVISKVLKGPRYMVYFRLWNEEMEFGHSELRLHHDWIGGRWLCASQALDL